MFRVNVIYNDTNTNIEFHCDEQYLYAKLSELHVSDEEKVTPKLFVKEVMDFDELKCMEECFTDLDELNYFAKRLDSLEGRELVKTRAAMALEELKTMPDLINLTFNSHYYTLIQDMSSPEKIGKQHYMTRNGGASEKELSEIDFAGIGKKLITSGQAKLTPYGLLVVNDDLEYERPYNGKTFPPFYYDDKKIGLSLEYKGEKEYIYLPDLPITIDKALNRLGAESIENCKVQFDSINYPNKEIDTILATVLENDGVNALNALANNLKFYCTEEGLNNFPDIVGYVGTDDFDTLMKITERIQSFIILRNVWDENQLGIEWMKNYTEYDPNDEIMEYFDFNEYGEHILEETDGKFMDNGDYICVEEGKTIKEVLGTEYGEELKMC
ncbi:MAG: antirestriction protein ArdA [Firmicutes bacterium]|nr:antirestriction protein ArdA [Bacillota bacterium]